MSEKVLRVAIIGCGDRGMNVYADIIKNKYSDKIEIVAAADADPNRLQIMKEKHSIPENMLFSDGNLLLASGKIADVLFICTQDRQHYEYAIPALKLGYDLLLEKPASPVLSECVEIEKTARKLGRKIIICHVLRYTAFYCKIKEIIDSGKIGDIVSIQAIEPVAYWHQAHSFVRGNWANSETSSPMILQKCCHDLDLFIWLTGKKCKRVSSFGSLSEFKAEKAPEGAKDRCYNNCPHIDTCQYSAKLFYMRQFKNGNSLWPVNVVCNEPTEDTLEAALRTGPYGRCVYKCDNNVVDHQVVNLMLEDDITINFTMSAFTKGTSRKICIMGTKGEINADFNSSIINIYPFTEPDETFDVNTINDDTSFHGGGDSGLLRDLYELIINNNPSSSITDIDISIQSHFAALAAEKSRLLNGALINIDEFTESFR